MLIDNNAIEVISNPAYITYLLLKAHGNRNGVTIISASCGLNHASSILEVNEANNSLLIEALSQGQSIPEDISEFTVMLEEVRTWFTVNNYSRETIGEDVFYRTPFPKSLHRLQRRNYFRVAVPMAINSRIMASAVDDSRTIIGVISDISLGGVGFSFPFDARKFIEAQSIVSSVFIELGNLCSLSVDLEICHVTYSSKTNSTIIGSQFRQLGTSESQKISLVVQELQRIELRNRKR